MISILRKELWGYLGNWSAWGVVAVFSLISGLFLFFFENNFNFFEIGTASMQSYFILAPWLFIFLIPALSMRALAEEQQTGTLNWLFFQPIKVRDIVLGKFWSIGLVGALCLLPSLVYFYTLSSLSIPEGNIDWGMTFGSYLGLLMLILAFSAVGVLASSLVANQVMAYIIGVFSCFFMYFGVEQLASYRLLGGADYILQNLGFYHHYIAFTRGLVDSKDVFYFIFIVDLSLRLAEFFVEKKR
ncbi:MAG: ABC transporter permease subunit [Flavobacteriaceae bacterium]|nr:ABC transporter permease subunit [Flavobacteriaceae bacterium]